MSFSAKNVQAALVHGSEPPDRQEPNQAGRYDLRLVKELSCPALPGPLSGNIVNIFFFFFFFFKRERNTHAAGDIFTFFLSFRELVFFPFSSDVYRGQKEQTKNNDYIHNGA